MRQTLIFSSVLRSFVSICFGIILIPLNGSPAHSTSYEKKLTSVPEWAKKAVWYQIFPERFRNGDSSNDPVPQDLAGSWPHEVARNWKISEWTGDWYELQPWEKEGKTGFYFHCQQRRYGGDLQGVVDKLDYLKDLGITAIYFNPLFESPSLHKYDASSYHHIDNNFGPDPDGDRSIWWTENPADATTWKWTSADRLFVRLLEEAHRRGIKVIVDGVFNHVGLTFWAFEDVKDNQQGSPYKHWFIIKRWDNAETEENEFEYQGWNGVRELPELREDANGLVRGPREHIKAVVKRWMDPNGDGNPSDGIDGWRLDVAEKVDRNFWREFRTWAREINPEAYLVGEVWWEDWQNDVMYNAAPWLEGDVFDAVMNYRWAREAFRFFGGKETKITAGEFVRRLKALESDYRSESNLVMMNLYDSHDTDRIGSHLVNADLRYDKQVGLDSNREYDVRKPGAREIATQKLMVIFQMTYVGAPTVYYGSEAGMWGADDPDCRKPMLWADLKFKAEESHPYRMLRKPDANLLNQDLFDFYTAMIGLRNKYEALSLGTLTPVLMDDERDLVAYVRSYGKEQILVVLNNSPSAQMSILSLPNVRTWEILVGTGNVRVEGGNAVVEVGSTNAIVARGTTS